MLWHPGIYIHFVVLEVLMEPQSSENCAFFRTCKLQVAISTTKYMSIPIPRCPCMLEISMEKRKHYFFYSWWKRRTKCYVTSYEQLSTNVTRSYTVSECDKMTQNWQGVPRHSAAWHLAHHPNSSIHYLISFYLYFGKNIISLPK